MSRRGRRPKFVTPSGLSLSEDHRFYVYELFDPRDGATFYVGKGRHHRISNHTTEAKAGKRGQKCAKIREIIASGHEIGRRIVAYFADEADALNFEIDLIASYGGTNLTNGTPGGEGGRTHVPGRIWCPYKVRSKAKLIRWMALRIERVGKLILNDIDYTESFVLYIQKIEADIGHVALGRIMREASVFDATLSQCIAYPDFRHKISTNAIN